MLYYLAGLVTPTGYGLVQMNVNGEDGADPTISDQIYMLRVIRQRSGDARRTAPRTAPRTWPDLFIRSKFPL